MMCRRAGAVLAAVALVGGAAEAQSPALTLAVENGRLTLDARDVPVARILDQWAKAQRITVVNGDTLSARVTLRLDDVPERQALDILLRGTSGYIATRRTSPAGDRTEIDRILIVRPGAPGAQTAAWPQPPDRFIAPARSNANAEDEVREAAERAGIPPEQAAGLTVEQIDLLQRPAAGVYSGEGPPNQPTDPRVDPGQRGDGDAAAASGMTRDDSVPPPPEKPRPTPGPIR